MLTGQDLVTFCKSKLGTPYVYGCKGEVLTLAKYNWLKKQYGSMVWDSDKNKVGKVCCDCSGLISWYTGKLLGSSQLYSEAKERHSISTIKEAPIGATLWKSGHVGVYIGLENGVPMYIAEDGSAYGCQKKPVAWNSFTHWLLQSYIDYSEPKKEVSKETTVKKGDFANMTAKQKEQFVKNVLYIGMLGRQVSTSDSGYKYWLNQLTDTANTVDIINSFANSQEAREYAVKIAYKNLLGRDVDASGLSYWANRLKTITVDALYTELKNTAEYKNKKK